MSEWAAVVVALAALVGGAIGTLVWLVWWLGEKFRSLEKLIYRELHQERQAVAEWRDDHIERIYKLETKVFGVSELVSPRGGRPRNGRN